jgi:ankyrin repeat protein
MADMVTILKTSSTLQSTLKMIDTMTTQNKRQVRPHDSLPPKKKMKLAAELDNYKSPTEFLLHVFQENGFSTEEVKKVARAKFLKLTPGMVQAYTMEITKAARDDDLDKLKELFHAGARLDCCNKFGDSLVHIACRRGHTRTLKFLVEEAKVSVHRADDMNRTPFHDACWTPEPNFEIIEILLRVAPGQVLCADNRGHLPFEYARPQHKADWMQFLSRRKSMMVLSET